MEPVVPSAERIYEEFRERRSRGEPVSIDEYCERHPERATALRLMHSVSAERLLSSAHDIPASGGAELGTIGKYRLVRSLGSGGFGEVYLARQPNPSRDVALKVLKPGMDTREFLGRFERERQALAALNHPNIAAIFEAGETDEGRPFFVMEYVPGKPITDDANDERLGVRERLEVFLKVCRAVQHAHQHGIIHRDLKPLNVLVTRRDGAAEPKIIDFGLAKAIDLELTEETLATQEGRIVGTPMYMAPEQVDSRLPLDRRVDVYALGVILYEILCGERPLEFPSPPRYGDLLRVLREQDPVTPSRRASRVARAGSGQPAASSRARSLSRELRGELDWITMKALEKDPRRRYSSASELASDLACYRKGEAVVAGPPSAMYRLRKLVRKQRVPLLAAFAAVLVVAYPMTSYIREAAHTRALISEAETSYREYIDLAGAVDEIHRQWSENRGRLPSWAPVWERGEEIEAWRRLLGLAERIQPLHVAAVTAIGRALRADVGAPARDDLAAKLEEVLSIHLAGGAGGKLALGELAKELPGTVPGAAPPAEVWHTLVAVESEPPGAQVYCFRNEEREARWIPLPFDPRLGRERPPEGVREVSYLLVDQVWPREDDEFKPPFTPGDRLVALDGSLVRSLGDLARRLALVDVGRKIDARFERGGETLAVGWTPWIPRRVERTREALEYYRHRRDAIPPGRLVDPYFQLGVTFAAYPLDFSPANLVGETEAGRPLRIELPRGSYLLVLRKPGYADTRLPVAALEKVVSETVRLMEAERVPHGFVYIPDGLAATGGDPKADQSFEWDYVPVKGFFMKKMELSAPEWVEFLNAPGVLERIDAETGRAPPRHPDLVQDSSARTVQLIPAQSGNLYLEKSTTTGRWQFLKNPSRFNPRWPAGYISHHAALEYLHWRNAQAEKDGEPWIYRLPTDLEWERAARGVDRRHYVWGSYPVWSFSRSLRGSFMPQAEAPGSFTFDESVFGVRDLAGSLREHTSGQPLGRFRTVRGGSHDDASDVYFRLASRNGLLPENWLPAAGVRLVAEIREGR